MYQSVRPTLYFNNHLFVARSRGSTHRSKTNPLGRRDSKACVDGNILTARTLILLTLAAAKCCFWVLEQPITSVMEYHPLFQKALRMLSMRRMKISMSHFGAPTPKRTILYSGPLGNLGRRNPPQGFQPKRSKMIQAFICWVLDSTSYRVTALHLWPSRTVLLPGHQCIDDLREHEEEPVLQQRQMVVKYTNARGEARVHGGADLKSSQSYPAGFGVALAKVRSKHQKRNYRKAMAFLRGARKTENKLDLRTRVNRAWMAGANLQPVIDFLSNR